jgi:hypothetical protein
MTAKGQHDQLAPPDPARAKAWHLWTIIIPRRSITGRLLWGRVWRRHDGRHWIYKQFVEHDAQFVGRLPHEQVVGVGEFALY